MRVDHTIHQIRSAIPISESRTAQRARSVDTGRAWADSAGSSSAGSILDHFLESHPESGGRVHHMFHDGGAVLDPFHDLLASRLGWRQHEDAKPGLAEPGSLAGRLDLVAGIVSNNVPTGAVSRMSGRSHSHGMSSTEIFNRGRLCPAAGRALSLDQKKLLPPCAWLRTPVLVMW